MTERIDGVELDDQTAGYVRRCAQRGGVDAAAAIAGQLRELAEAEARREAAVDELIEYAAAEREAAVYVHMFG